jgi:dTDP-4-amino-4,6-dideoxygalactose transaminase
MPEAEYNRCTRWLTVILIDPEKFGANREAVRLALEAENIESRPVWKPMHLQPVFNCGELETVNCERELLENDKSEIRNPKSETIPKPSMTKIQNKERLAVSSDPSPITHYPSPAVRIVGGKISEELFEKGLCLPSGTAMSEEDLERVVRVIKALNDKT